MQKYAVRASLIQSAFHIEQIRDSVISKSIPYYNRSSPMLHSWSDAACYSFFTISSSPIDPSFWQKYFELWFVSTNDFIPVLYYPVFVRLGPMGHFEIILFPQQLFLDSKSAIKIIFTESSSNSECWHIFSWHWFCCAVMFGVVSLLSRELVTLTKLSSDLVALCLPTESLFVFGQVSWYLPKV